MVDCFEMIEKETKLIRNFLLLFYMTNQRTIFLENDQQIKSYFLEPGFLVF